MENPFASAASVVPADDPLFVNHNENVGVSLVSQVLVGEQNYLSWQKSMELALGIKMKLGFIRGEIPRPADPYQATRWDRCNSVVLSWLIHSVSPEIGSALIHVGSCIKAWEDLRERFSGSTDFTIFALQNEIALLLQDNMSIAEYYNKLVQLWGDEDALTVETACEFSPNCKAMQCAQDRKIRDRRMKFLMGLNSSFTVCRSNILQMRPSPSLKECYQILMQDEKQRKTRDPSSEMSAFYAGPRSTAQLPPDSSQPPRSSQQPNRKPYFCTYCKKHGHLKDKCYKLHGYPNDDKSPAAQRNTPHLVNNVSVDAATADAVSGDSMSQSSQLSSVKEQLQKIVALLSDSGVAKPDHLAGIACFSSIKSSQFTWVIDSGATDHITPYRDLLFNVTELKSPTTILLPNGHRVGVTHYGSCAVTDQIVLDHVLLVPNIQFNLLSVAKVVHDSNLRFSFTNKGCYIQDPHTQILKGTGTLVDGLYKLDCGSSPRILAAVDSSKLVVLWHNRLGHVPVSKLTSILKQSLPAFRCTNSDLLCHVCPSAKQTRVPFPVSSSVSDKLFDLVHMDIWGPYKHSTLTGAKYFLTVVEDKSRITWTYLMTSKSEVSDLVIWFYKMVQTQFGYSVKTIRSDNGAEFLSGKVTDFLKSTGCIQQFSCVFSPQQNGIVERKHRHLLEVARSLKFQSKVPDFMWGDCILTATYIINRVPSSVLHGKSPFEVFFNRQPDYTHMRVFGCLCYMTNLKHNKSKFDQRAFTCVFVGYSYASKGYRVFDLDKQIYYTSRDVIFVEDRFPYVDHSLRHTQTPSDNLYDPTTPFEVTVPDSASLPVVPTVIFPTDVSVPGPLPVSAPDVPTSPSPATSDAVPASSSANTPPGIISDSESAPDPPHVVTSDSIPASVPLRKSTRARRPNVTLRDYVCNSAVTSRTKHPIHLFLSYKGCSDQFQKFALQVLDDTEPSSFTQASKDKRWLDAMHTELDALHRNNTWEIATLPPDKNAISCKWVFRVKRNADGTVDRFKARLVARGFSQTPGLDYHETFSPVVKMNTVRTLLAVAVAKNWTLHQLDVDNAFLHGELNEEVYMTPPPGFFKGLKTEGKVLRLKKSLYGLKQAPRQWFTKFSDALLGFGFLQSENDSSLFTYCRNGAFIALLVYVDDVILAGNSSDLISTVKSFLHAHFSIKDLGSLRYFLGFEIARSAEGLFINQRKYALQLLSEAGLLDAKPAASPMDCKQKLALSSAAPLADPEVYRRLIGQLVYITNTRPDLSYAVHLLSQFLHQPTEDHLVAAHRVLRYLKGAPAQGLFYPSNQPLVLTAYSDSDWAACPITRKSITGYAVHLGGALISWKSKKQAVISRSSAEAEYRAMAHCCSEVLWLQRLLKDLNVVVPTPIPLFCDNSAAIHIARNPVFHERTKHIELDCHFVRHQYTAGLITPQHISTLIQPADLFTKPLPADQLLLLSSKLNISNKLHMLSLRGGVTG